MTENKSPTADLPEPDENACTRVMVGHAISVLDDEAAVCIDISGRSARLSVAGARIVAQQITAWADHAEERNKARPGDTMVKLMYRVIEKAGGTPAPAPEEPKKQWQVIGDGDGNFTAKFDAAEAASAILQNARKRSAKRPAKKTARKGKRK